MMTAWKRGALVLSGSGVMVAAVGGVLMAGRPDAQGAGQTVLLIGLGLLFLTVPVIDRGLSGSRPQEGTHSAPPDSPGSPGVGLRVIGRAWFGGRGGPPVPPERAEPERSAPPEVLVRADLATSPDSSRDPLASAVRNLLLAWDPPSADRGHPIREAYDAAAARLLVGVRSRQDPSAMAASLLSDLGRSGDSGDLDPREPEPVAGALAIVAAIEAMVRAAG